MTTWNKTSGQFCPRGKGAMRSPLCESTTRVRCPTSRKERSHALLSNLHNIYMLLTGWEVRIGKNCDRGHSFSLYGPTLSRTITCLSFFLAVNCLQVGLFTQVCHWIGLRAVYRLYKPLVKNLTSERASNSDTRQRKCIKEQIIPLSVLKQCSQTH